MTRNEKEWVSHQPKSYLLYKVVKVPILNEKKGVEGGGGEADAVTEFRGDDDDGRRPLGEEFLGSGGVEAEAAGGPDEGANLLSDEGLGSGEGEDGGEVGGGTGEDSDAVLILLRGEGVTDDGEDVGGVVQLHDAVVVDGFAFGVLAVEDGI